MSYSDDPKKWAPCNRCLSPAEYMYAYAVDLPIPEPKELLGPAERPIKRAKKKDWFEVGVG